MNKDEQFLKLKKKLESFQQSLSSKEVTESNYALQKRLETSKNIKSTYKMFSKACAVRSEMVRYFNIVLKLTSILKNVRVAVREGNWFLHLRVIPDMVPVFCQSGSIIYQRYCYLYLDRMKNLPYRYSDIYQHF